MGSLDVHLRYLEDDAELNPFLGARPRDAQELLRQAPLNARRLVEPAQLGAALEAYAQRHAAPEPVIENARRIGSGTAFAIVTGQQPGLFGGPLYTIHKAATAIRLARDLSRVPDAPAVVPVFWNHSDDHDLDEVNRAFLVNGNQDLQRLRLDVTHQGEPIRSLGVGRALEQALAAAGDLLPRSEFREWALSLFTPRHPDEHLGDGLARLLFGLFGHHGLLVIEPRDLPAPAFDALPRWRTQENEIRARVRGVAEHMSDVGLDVTLDPAATLMFQCSGGRRIALSDEDSIGAARDLSPGVLLRPLWQDACLPSIGFVVGPGELSYLTIVGSLYKTLGVPRPAFVPRASLTLVEPSLRKLLDRFGWDLPDLAVGPDELVKGVETDDDGPVERGLDELAAMVRTRFAEFEEAIREVDKGMVGSIERARGKLVDELEKLSGRVRNARRNRQGTGARQIRRLCSNLRPRGRKQERVLSVLPFLVAHGVELADWLVDAADPFSIRHGVLEL